ncbi:MAG: hypothetical protein AAB383_02015 [Patescibacteria group bacterium]
MFPPLGPSSLVPTTVPTTPDQRVDAVMAQVPPFEEAILRSDFVQVFEGKEADLALRGVVLQDTLRGYIRELAATAALEEAAPGRESLDLAVGEFESALAGFLAQLRVKFASVQQGPISQALGNVNVGTSDLQAIILEALSYKKPDALIEEYIAALKAPHLSLMAKAGCPDLPAPAPHDAASLKTQLVDYFVASAKEAYTIAREKLREYLLNKEQEAERAELAAHALKRVPGKTVELMDSIMVNSLDRRTYADQEKALFITFGSVLRDLTGKQFGPKLQAEFGVALAEGFTPPGKLTSRIRNAEGLIDVYRGQASNGFISMKLAEIQFDKEEALMLCAQEYIQWVNGKAAQIFTIPEETDPSEAELYDVARVNVVDKFFEVATQHADKQFAKALSLLTPSLPSVVVPLLAHRVQETLAQFVDKQPVSATSVQAQYTPDMNLTTDAEAIVDAFLAKAPLLLAKLENPAQLYLDLFAALVREGKMDREPAALVARQIMDMLFGKPEGKRETVMSLGRYSLTRSPKVPKAPKVPPVPPAPSKPKPTSRKPISRNWLAGGLAVGLAGVAAAGVAYNWSSPEVEEVPVESPEVPVTPTQWGSLNPEAYPTFENTTMQWFVDLSKQNPEQDVGQGAIAIQCVGGENKASSTSPAQAHSFTVLSDAVTDEGTINWIVEGCQVKGFKPFTPGACVADVCALNEGFYAVALTPEQN